MRKINRLNLKSKKVLLRVDFNVPLESGKILDDYRIKVEVPAIKKLMRKKAKIILISHLGRPEGRV
jgi:phosphoglycerate kinase